MGQLTLALEATRELRKQFVKQKAPKKLSKRHQRIQDLIYGQDFGCSKDGVAKLIGALEKVNLVRGADVNRDVFIGVKGSVIVHVSDDSHSGTVTIDTFSEGYVHWKDGGDDCSYNRYKDSWRPATDKEIREYFS